MSLVVDFKASASCLIAFGQETGSVASQVGAGQWGLTKANAVAVGLHEGRGGEGKHSRQD